MAHKTPHPEAPVASFDHPTSSLERFLEDNLKTLLIAGAVIFVGIMGYLIYNYFAESGAAEEANAFTSAETTEEYRAVISKFPGSLAAGNAQLMIGRNLSAEEDTKQDGIAELRTFVESYPDHPLRPNGLFELGSILVSDGNVTEATSLFDSLISEYPGSHLTPYAELCKGDFAYQDGNPDEARKIYSSVLTSHPGTQAAQLAEQRIDMSKIDPPVSVEPAPEPEPAASVPPIAVPPSIAAPTPAPDEGEGDGETPAATTEEDTGNSSSSADQNKEAESESADGTDADE